MSILRQPSQKVKQRPVIDLTDGLDFLTHYKAACAAILEVNSRLFVCEGEIVFCTEGQIGSVDPHTQRRLNESGQGHLRALSMCGYTRAMKMEEFGGCLATICDWRIPADRHEYRAILLLLYLVHDAPGAPFPELIDYEKEPADAHCN